jgi:hypothetical protein
VKKLPKGLDQQGRHPEAAEACTEVGQDEPEFYGWRYFAVSLWEGLLVAVFVSCVFVGIGWLVGAL